jgi:pyrimidine oxygenase
VAARQSRVYDTWTSGTTPPWRHSCFAAGIIEPTNEARVKIGVFIPIGNNGWLISENAPQYWPSFALNKQVTLTAERYGVDFVLSMIKLRGFGGKTEFWDHNLESFTLMAGLAAVTTRIKLFATCATLVIPPAIAARMASTIDSISDGRFGLNLITGWQKPEYSQMGLWPGDEYFGRRYQYVSEYIQIMRELWDTGHSDFKGEFFKMEDCRLSPRPQAEMKIICAGQSEAGMAFSAQYADYNFCFGKGVNTPVAFAPTVAKLTEANAKTGRNVTAYALFMVIADETDEAAQAKWECYKAGKDLDALSWLGAQASNDDKADVGGTAQSMINPVSAVNFNMGTVVGSYATVAKMLDELDTVEGLAGVMLTFDDFIIGMENFGQRIQPLMACRSHVLASA